MRFAALPRQKGLSMVHTAALLGCWHARILTSVAAAAAGTAKVAIFVAEQQELGVALIPPLAASQAVLLRRELVALQMVFVTGGQLLLGQLELVQAQVLEPVPEPLAALPRASRMPR